MKGRSRIGFCLLAAALFGASAIGAGFAQEGGSGAHGDSKASSLPAESGTSHPSSGENAGDGSARLERQFHADAKGDDGKTPKGEETLNGAGAAANDAKAFAPGDKNEDAIDTRDTVLPHRLGNRRDAVEEVKALKSVAPRNLLGRRTLSHGATEGVARNAIGIPVARRDGSEQHVGQHRDFPIGIHGPAPAAIGANESTTSRLAKAQGRIDRGTTSANPIVRPAVSNRGTINGTSLMRAGSGPSGIGGPAKTVAGINGTAIRPKH